MSVLRGWIRACVWTLVLVIGPAAWGGTVTWTGLGKGVSWTDPGNWSSAPNLPGPGDDVEIGAGTQTVQLNAGFPQSVRSLRVARNVKIYSPITLTDGSVSLDGNPTVKFARTGGFLFAPGQREIAGTGILQFSAVAFDPSDATLIDVPAGCDLTIGLGLTILVYNSEVEFSINIHAGAAPGVPGGIVRNKANFSVYGASVIATVRAIDDVTPNDPVRSPQYLSEGGVSISGGSLEIATRKIHFAGGLSMSSGNLTLAASEPDLGNAPYATANCSLNLPGVNLTPGTVYTAPAPFGFIALPNTLRNITLEGMPYTQYICHGLVDGCTFNTAVELGGATIMNGLTLNGPATVLYADIIFTGPAQTLRGPGIVGMFLRAQQIIIDGGCELTVDAGPTVSPLWVWGDVQLGWSSDTPPKPSSVVFASPVGVARASNNPSTLQISNTNPANGDVRATFLKPFSVPKDSTLDVGPAVRVINAAGLILDGAWHLSNLQTDLGTLTRGPASKIQYAGNLVGTTLLASDATGTLELEGSASHALTIAGSGSGRVIIRGGTLDACTIGPGVDLVSRLTVTNGLTLAGDCTLQFNVVFAGGDQVVGGSGKLLFTPPSYYSGTYRLVMSADDGAHVTIGPGVTITQDPGQLKSVNLLLALNTAADSAGREGQFNLLGSLIILGEYDTLTLQRLGTGTNTTSDPNFIVGPGGVLSIGGDTTLATGAYLRNDGVISVKYHHELRLNGRINSLAGVDMTAGGVVSLNAVVDAGSLFLIPPTVPSLAVGGSYTGVKFKNESAAPTRFTVATLRACAIDGDADIGPGSLLTIEQGLRIDGRVSTSGNYSSVSFGPGDQTFDGNCQLLPTSPLTINISSGCRLTIGSGVSIISDAVKKSTITMKMGDAANTGLDFQGVFNLAGTLSIGSSTNSTAINQSLINEGSVVIASGSALSISAPQPLVNLGRIALGPGVQYTNAQSGFPFGDFTADPTAAITVHPIVTPSSTLKIPAGLPMFSIHGPFDGVTFDADPGVSLKFAPGSSWNRCTLNAPALVSGAITNTGGLTVNAPLTLQAGTLNFVGGTQFLGGTGSIRVAGKSSGEIGAASGCQLTIGAGLTLGPALAGDGSTSALSFRLAGSPSDRSPLLCRIDVLPALDVRGTGRSISVTSSSLLRSDIFNAVGGITAADGGTFSCLGPTLLTPAGLAVLPGGTLKTDVNPGSIGGLVRDQGTIVYSPNSSSSSTVQVTGPAGIVGISPGTYSTVVFRADPGITLALADSSLFNCTIESTALFTSTTDLYKSLTINAPVILSGKLRCREALTFKGNGSLLVAQDTTGEIVVGGTELTISPGLTLGPAPAGPGTSRLMFSLGVSTSTMLPVQCAAVLRASGPGRSIELRDASTRQNTVVVCTGPVELRGGAWLDVTGTSPAGRTSLGTELDIAGSLTTGAGSRVNLTDAGRLVFKPGSFWSAEIAGPAADPANFPGVSIKGPGNDRVSVSGELRATFVGDFDPPSCAPAYSLIVTADIAPGSPTVSGAFATLQLPPVTGPNYASRVYITPRELGFVCTSRADITGTNNTGPSDGRVTAADLVVFMNTYFTPCTTGAVPCNPADVTDPSGTGAPDGQLTVSDVVAFVGALFEGCGP